jgi:DNA-binding transcriptional ArsR family regulator
MVERQEAQLDLVFHALADSTRRKILQALGENRELTISEMAEPFRMSLAAVSKHIKVLERAGLIQRSVDGRIHRCRMDAAPLKQASQLIAHYQQFWEGQFDAIEKYLNEQKETKK